MSIVTWLADHLFAARKRAAEVKREVTKHDAQAAQIQTDLDRWTSDHARKVEADMRRTVNELAGRGHLYSGAMRNGLEHVMEAAQEAWRNAASERLRAFRALARAEGDDHARLRDRGGPTLVLSDELRSAVESWRERPYPVPATGEPFRPRTPYAATKAFSDLLGQVYAHAYELDVVSLRFTEVYGPGRTAPSALHEIVDAAVTSRIVELPAGAAHPYDVVHVEDVARAVTAALEASTPPGRVYDISGERVSLEQVVAILRDRLPDVQVVGKPGDSPRCVTHGPISAAAADAELGYRPRWGLARGIDDLCAWLEAEEAC